MRKQSDATKLRHLKREIFKLFKAIQEAVEDHGPIVLWTGDGEFPGRASRLRGLHIGRAGGAKAALYSFAGVDLPAKPKRIRGKR